MIGAGVAILLTGNTSRLLDHLAELKSKRRRGGRGEGGGRGFGRDRSLAVQRPSSLNATLTRPAIQVPSRHSTD